MNNVETSVVPTAMIIPKSRVIAIIKSHYTNELVGLCITDMFSTTYTDEVKFELAPEIRFERPEPPKMREKLEQPPSATLTEREITAAEELVATQLKPSS